MTMEIYSLAFDFIERVATSVVAVIISKIAQWLGNKKKYVNPFEGLKLY